MSCAPSLTCRSDFEMALVFRGNDLLALMLNCLALGGELELRRQIADYVNQSVPELRHSSNRNWIPSQ